MLRLVRPRLLRNAALFAATTVAASAAFSGAAQAISLTNLTSESFTAATTADAGWVTPGGSGNVACLTAGTSTTQLPIKACSTSAMDAAGSGTLRLTGNGGNLVGTVYNTTSLPTAQGLDVTFNTYQWNGTGADGIAFILAATNPTDPQPPATLGPLGGSLGYSATTAGASGVSYGYLGFGLDVFGNFEASGFGGSGCSGGTATPQSITVRGPGNGTAGYCVAGTTVAAQPLDARSATSRPSPTPVEIVLNPSTSSATTASGLSVGARQWLMRVTPVGGSPQTITGSLPTAVALSNYGFPSSWYDPTTGLPYQLTFGWAASTGGSNEIHEINTLTSKTLNGTLPSYQLAVSDNVGGAPMAGNRAVVSVTPSLDPAQGSEGSPVTVTTTFPSGLTPLTINDPDYTCTTSGQKVSCLYVPPSTVSPGSSLPTLDIPVSVGTGASYTVTAKVSSNDGNPKTATRTLTPVAFTASATPASVVHGATSSLSVSGIPAAATGTVAFTSGGSTLCTATLPATSCSTATTLAAATYPVTATYSGDSTFVTKTATTSLTVTKAATAMTASATPSSTSYGTSTTLDVAGLPGDATGTVAFSAGGSTLCTATLPTTSCVTSSSLASGSYAVTATYAGDVSHTGSSASTSFVVTKAATPFTASVSDPSVPFGTTDTLAVAGIPSGATGTVTFTSGGSTLCSVTLPATSCATSATLDPGSYAVTATYSGDANHLGDTDTTSFDVTKAATSLVAGVSDPTVTFGTADTLTLAGLPSGATGAVTFTAGSTTLCTATLPATSCTTSTALDAGTYAVTATYSGDSHHTGSTDTTSFVVSRSASSGLAAAASPASTPYGSADTLSFSGLAAGSTGTVTFTSGGTSLCTATLPATSCLAPSGLDVDTYPVTAAYSGDANHEDATASTTFDVVKAATALTAAAADASVVYGTTDTLTFSGLPAGADGTVTFTSGGQTLCTATLPATSCTTPSGMDAGTHAVTATYSGDDNHLGSTDTTTFDVAKAATSVSAGVATPRTQYGTPQTITWGGLPAGATGTITVTSGGQTLCTATLPDTTCDAPSGLAVGTYPVTVTYSGDSNHLGSSDGATYDVVKASTAVVAGVSAATVPEGTGVELSATGLPAGATGTVTFVSAGRVLCTVTLPATTCPTSNGLSADDYQVTATYSGDAHYLGSTDATRFNVTAPVQETSTATSTGGSSTSVPVPDAGRASSITVVKQPAHGTVRIVAGQVVYTPDAGYTGADGVVVKIVYADGTVKLLTVAVTAKPAVAAAHHATVVSALSSLPRTGASVLLPAVLGVALVTGGTVLVRVARRQQG